MNFLVPSRWRKAHAANTEDRLPGKAWYGLRRERVERAKRLIADITYPPREVLRAVAETLLRQIKFWLPYLNL